MAEMGVLGLYQMMLCIALHNAPDAPCKWEYGSLYYTELGCNDDGHHYTHFSYDGQKFVPMSYFSEIDHQDITIEKTRCDWKKVNNK